MYFSSVSHFYKLIIWLYVICIYLWVTCSCSVKVPSRDYGKKGNRRVLGGIFRFLKHSLECVFKIFRISRLYIFRDFGIFLKQHLAETLQVKIPTNLLSCIFDAKFKFCRFSESFIAAY